MHGGRLWRTDLTPMKDLSVHTESSDSAFATSQSGSDIVRHLGTHANSERLLIEEGHLEQMDAAMLNIYMANPGLAETIDPEFCTCYVCDISFVRKDSMERHLKTQHDAPATLIKDISAAIRGRKMNLGH